MIAPWTRDQLRTALKEASVLLARALQQLDAMDAEAEKATSGVRLDETPVPSDQATEASIAGWFRSLGWSVGKADALRWTLVNGRRRLVVDRTTLLGVANHERRKLQLPPFAYAERRHG